MQIKVMTQYEALKLVRKNCARPGQSFKVKTKFRRKPKHFKGWD